MMDRLLDGLAVVIFLLVMTLPAFLLALLDTPAGRIGLVLSFVEGFVLW
jgi:hypothetical protein